MQRDYTTKTYAFMALQWIIMQYDFLIFLNFVALWFNDKRSLICRYGLSWIRLL